MRERLFHSKTLRLALQLSVFTASLFAAGSSFARPDMTPLGPNIADKGSAFYHFTVNTFDSVDGQRHYKVWTAIPDKPAPAAGYPLLYMLDGNAVMDRLSDSLLQKLSQQNPPVLVVVGYQTDEPFALSARAYDDTPPVSMAGSLCQQQATRGRPCGGGLIFRQLLEQTIAPQAEKGLKIDSHQRGIWGHSLGGLYVLDSWRSSSLFNRYYATSPSLNRDYIGMLDEMAQIDPRKVCHKQLIFMEGSPIPGKNKAGAVADAVSRVHATLPALRSRGLAVADWSFPELNHGEMFNAGFQRALFDMAAPDKTLPAANCPP
ncbi:alpha/beta hydrolase [Pantoea sp. A4]|uniref:alpha/beta hydrolase n=1 Tax=Pantoea sp. A4 TaxID=1225184 RepID=UPI0008FADAC5|nr:alpha/beta hydrolase-fold protein [Pantoea sp. A4]